MKVNYVEHDAVISDCGIYRYLLRRTWDHSKPRALIVMLNPSTADAEVDDATIRSCVRLCMVSKYGSFEVVNLFAFRSTDPAALARASNPIGPRNNELIEAAVLRCDIPIIAWGAYPGAIDRGRAVRGIVRAHRPATFCWGKTKFGAPKHPLYVSSKTPLETYRG